MTLGQRQGRVKEVGSQSNFDDERLVATDEFTV